MNKFWISLFTAILLLVTMISRSLSIQTTDDPSCIKSFHQFSYGGPEPRAAEREVIPPDLPWQRKLNSSNLPDVGYPYTLNQTELARSIDGHPEIWFYLGDRYFALNVQKGIAIYLPNSQALEVIPRYVDDTDLYVKELYIDSQGAIWGSVSWDNLADYPDLTGVPVLSKFNENTRRFEFVEGVFETPLHEEINYIDATEIVLDHNDIFWIFANDGQIYRYDPVAQTTMRRDGLGTQVVYTALSSDGDIYFSLNDWNPGLMMHQGSLFRLSTASEEITVVEVPEGWPLYAGLLVDRSEQLWLGAIGYRDLSNNWQLLHAPYLRTYADHLGQYMWAAPKILFEGSDGRLWFNKYLDSGLNAEGTAWFDPETKQGCMVTNVPTNVIEDADQRLWMTVDGVLYSYSLVE
jgi:hypothetical protein